MLGESHPPKEAKRVKISPLHGSSTLHNPAEGNAKSGNSGLGRQAGGVQAVSASKERTVGGTTRSKRATTQQCRHFQVASSSDSGARPLAPPSSRSRPPGMRPPKLGSQPALQDLPNADDDLWRRLFIRGVPDGPEQLHGYRPGGYCTISYIYKTTFTTAVTESSMNFFRAMCCATLRLPTVRWLLDAAARTPLRPIVDMQTTKGRDVHRPILLRRFGSYSTCQFLDIGTYRQPELAVQIIANFRRPVPPRRSLRSGGGRIVRPGHQHSDPDEVAMQGAKMDKGAGSSGAGSSNSFM
ncbi:hypothetical protein PCL_11260 [Purpureocillium lilacinum]|uniref:Uncharacterized protein n=1 Tax=Purpureocillium lilacinum TaxID=33203 RepID=A0A2U3DQ40_PURLI|nr:hypothetical protein PCL_11260 [Purpureocillium lilacinum]